MSNFPFSQALFDIIVNLQKKGVTNQRLDVYFKFLGASSYLRTVAGSVVNDKDPGNVSMLESLIALSLPTTMTVDSFQNYLGLYGMSYRIPNMELFFADVLHIFEEVDCSYWNSEPTSKCSLSVGAATGTNCAGQQQISLKVQTGDITVLKHVITPVTQKILVSKHCGFQAQYDADIQKGYPNFIILQRAAKFAQK
jgi:hypothetical protein